MTQPQRRTQAERHAETHRRIIDATIACIDEQGFHNTTMQRVARSAGVTVGAVQHHFPSKSELLAAVLEDSFQKMSFDMESILFKGKTLEQRVSLFVDHCWQHCNSSAFQANLQILSGMRSESPGELEQWMQHSLRSIALQGRELWLRVFDDVRLSEEAHFDLLLFVFSSLGGSAQLSRISQQQSRVDCDLALLKEMLSLKFTKGNPQ
jgi:AcrR family transcriptional regulator